MKPYPKPEKREKRKPKPIKKKADKRAKQETEYLNKRKAFLSENPICKFKECKLEATTVHHAKGRIGSLLTNENYFIGLCMEHHRFIELNPNFAKANGYSKSRLTNI